MWTVHISTSNVSWDREVNKELVTRDSNQRSSFAMQTAGFGKVNAVIKISAPHANEWFAMKVRSGLLNEIFCD